LRPVSAAPYLRPEIEIDEGPPRRIRWHVGDLRPHEQAKLAAVGLFITAEHAGQSLEVRWSATAKDAEGVATGVLGIEVSATPFKASIAELIDRHDEP
jgi:hypothetical protein